MREFGLLFDKQLWRGLRAFPSPRHGEDGLVECHNLIPGEQSLRGYVHITDIFPGLPPDGDTAVLDYLLLYDQGDVPWYIYGGENQTTLVSTTVPFESGYTSTAIITGVPRYWLKLSAIDSPSTLMYIFPAEESGDLLVASSSPPLGVEYNGGAGVVMHVLGGDVQTLVVNSGGSLLWQ